MIKIKRSPAPTDLTEALASQLTEEFRRDPSKDVWNKPFIRQNLIAMSSGKCAYCETNITEEAKYLEVEHFYCKSKHKEKVVLWSNLLPSCKRCNNNKSDHDVVKDGMIIDPSEINPKDHIKLLNYRLIGRDDVGKRTISTIYLNESRRLVTARFEIGEKVQETLERINDHLVEYLAGNTTIRKKNIIIRGMDALLQEAHPSKAYSATTATVILSSDLYFHIKDSLERIQLWNENLTILNNIAEEIALI